ncbi:MAG: hypothetical protein ABSD88_20460, partial [Candidatus Korobacteraceae bacterium]
DPQLFLVYGRTFDREAPLPGTRIEFRLATNCAAPEDMESVIQIDAQLSNSLPNIRVKPVAVLFQIRLKLFPAETCALHVV